MKAVGADDVVGLNSAIVVFRSFGPFLNSSRLLGCFYYIRRSAGFVSNPKGNGVRKLRIRPKPTNVRGGARQRAGGAQRTGSVTPFTRNLIGRWEALG
jgi:hypothetical protein